MSFWNFYVSKSNNRSSPLNVIIDFSSNIDHNQLYLLKVNYLNKNLPLCIPFSDRLSIDSNLLDISES